MANQKASYTRRSTFSYFDDLEFVVLRVLGDNEAKDEFFLNRQLLL